MMLEDPQPETAVLAKAGVQRVAHRIVESHHSEFLERAPGAATYSLLWLLSPTVLSTEPMGNN